MEKQLCRGPQRSLHTIVADVSGVLSSMAQGDFSVRPGMEYMGSFEEINSSFRMIQSTLNGIIMSINSSSADVSAGTQQMSDGSQLLAEGTTKQATAVDELSSTITDISDNIAKTAENAGKAREISTTCANRITAQGEEVEEMLLAMEQIQKQSAASCEELSAQARILKEQVDRLKI